MTGSSTGTMSSTTGYNYTTPTNSFGASRNLPGEYSAGMVQAPGSDAELSGTEAQRTAVRRRQLAAVPAAGDNSTSLRANEEAALGRPLFCRAHSPKT